MAKLALAIVLAALTGCADLDVWYYERWKSGETRTANEKAKPDSPRAPALDDDTYMPRRR